MKLSSLVPALSLVAFLASHSLAAADSFDSKEATIQKVSDSKAKVMVGKETYMAPISFADGASWDTVKDHYEIDPSAVSCLASKKASISIGSDGGASFTKLKK